MARISDLLGKDADSLLTHTCKTIDRSLLHLPGPDFVDRILAQTDRSIPVLRNLQSIFNHGRLAGTGYLSILPVDQGIEHSAGASFAPNPLYFDPENIVRLAIEGGCNAVATTLGVLGAVARRYAHKIPFLAQAQPQRAAHLPEQVRPDHVRARPAGGRHGLRRRRRDDLLRLRRVRPPDPGSVGGVPGRARARHGHRAVVLPAQRRLQEGRRRLPRRRRPHEPGQPPRRHHRGRHHQAEGPREQRRLHRAELRQDQQAGLQHS